MVVSEFTGPPSPGTLHAKNHKISPFRRIVIAASDIRGVSETVAFRRAGESVGALLGPAKMPTIRGLC